MADCWFGWPMVETESGLLRAATLFEVQQHALRFGEVLKLTRS